MKVCTKCNIEKSSEEFYHNPKSRGGLDTYCKSCKVEYQRAYYATNRSAILQRQTVRVRRSPAYTPNSNLKQNYGITLADKTHLWQTQQRQCANLACNKPLLLLGTKEQRNDIATVDHRHGTRIVRGLLCQACNKALGYVRDDAKRLQGLIDYLDKQKEQLNG